MSFEDFRKFVLQQMRASKQGSTSVIKSQPFQSTTSSQSFQSTTNPLKQGNSISKGGCCGKRA